MSFLRILHTIRYVNVNYLEKMFHLKTHTNQLKFLSMRKKTTKNSTNRSLIRGSNLIKSMQTICCGNQWVWWSLYFPFFRYLSISRSLLLFFYFLSHSVSENFPNVLMSSKTHKHTHTNPVVAHTKPVGKRFFFALLDCSPMFAAWIYFTVFIWSKL